MNKEFIFQEIDSKRLDIFLVEQLAISRSKIKKMVENQQIYVNDKIASKTGIQLESNDKIIICDFEANNEIQNSQPKPLQSLQPIPMDLQIIYEDEWLAIVQKPSGILVYPTSFNEEITFVNGLMHHFHWDPQKFDDQFRMGIVHRLDKDTAGLMIIAKTQQTVNALNEMFMQHKIEKHYHAIVYNHFLKLNQPIYVDVLMGYEKTGKYKMRIGNDVKNGKQAISIVTPLQNLNQGFSLVDVQILTGRTHQIRATMRYLNHPILNDALYGPRTKTTNYGQYLFCNFIKFQHPFQSQLLEFHLEYDANFQQMYDKLSK